uniref:Uncharacterized protein n=1 Tax=Cyclopterus lumpus TaxID=8103 RepID=A0A8C3GAS6_CYCLU
TGMSNSGTKEPSPELSTSQSPPEPQRRGRGRPRKQLQEPVGPPTPKRPRGRPKGSKNKDVNKWIVIQPSISLLHYSNTIYIANQNVFNTQYIMYIYIC